MARTTRSTTENQDFLYKTIRENKDLVVIFSVVVTMEFEFIICKEKLLFLKMSDVFTKYKSLCSLKDIEFTEPEFHYAYNRNFNALLGLKIGFPLLIYWHKLVNSGSNSIEQWRKDYK